MKSNKNHEPDQSGPGEALGPDSTTGSGISEAERRIHDGSSPQQPANPEDEEAPDEQQDYPGNDSRH